MINDVCKVYEAVVDIMCRHCNPTLYNKCKHLSEHDRCEVKIICMKNILKRDDGAYPTEIPKLNKIEKGKGPKPWEQIRNTVVEAAKDRNEELFGGQRPYIKIKYLVEWINERREKYSVFKDATIGQIRVWIQYAIHQMKWKTWNGSARSSSSVTYIVPWVEEKRGG